MGRLLHVRYRMAGTGRIAASGPSGGGGHVFDRYFLLGLPRVSAFAAQVRKAPAGFLVRTGAGNAHGSK